MRIVLDTNVIAAAFAARGLCGDIFEVCVSGHNLVISEHTLAAVNSALAKKMKMPKKIIHDITGYLSDVAEIVEPDHVDNSVCRDKHDLPVIGTAAEGNADFIIT